MKVFQVACNGDAAIEPKSVPLDLIKSLAAPAQLVSSTEAGGHGYTISLADAEAEYRNVTRPGCMSVLGSKK